MSKIVQTACHECDLIVNLPSICTAHKAQCPRCGFVITRFNVFAKQYLFIFSTTALVFFGLAFLFPFLIFVSQGNESSVNLIGSLINFGDGEYLVVVIFMITTTLLVPLLFLVGIIYAVISASLRRPLPFARDILRMVFYLRPWNMAEIYLVGILVSMVKILSLASVEFGLSYFAFVLFIFFTVLSKLFLDKFQIWRWMYRHYEP